jgi:hypothetical protein
VKIPSGTVVKEAVEYEGCRSRESGMRRVHVKDAET